MQEDPSGQPEPLPDDGSLEFKPAVRYTGYGLLAALAAGLGYALFSIGYHQGASEAVASGEVADQLNAVAVANLTHLLQVSSADEATLRRIAAHPESALGWIRDEAIRREAEWLVAKALLERGVASPDVAPLLADLFARAPQDIVWARRAEQVAQAHAAVGHGEAAQPYYRYAASRYGQAGSLPDQYRAMASLAAALAYAPAPQDSAAMNLESMLEELSGKDTAETRPLAGSIMACLAHVHQVRGETAEAERYAQAVLDMVQPDTASAQPVAAVCAASALIEQGKMEQAAALLEAALPALGQQPEAAPCLPEALCKLAYIRQEENDVETAFSLLGRAEGLAIRAIPPNSAFWSGLYDQRGWLYILTGKWEAALDDFNRALAPGLPAPRIQPLEGAARCLLALNRPEEALSRLQECLDLRRNQSGEGAAAARGRLEALMASAYDQAGQTPKAVSFYRLAAETLAGATEEGALENRILALRGLGYAAAQLGQWQDAVQAWETLLPLLREQRRDAAEALRQLRFCRSNAASRRTSTAPEEGATE